MFNYWEFIAGLGMFLVGMTNLESALKTLAGRRFKLFLRKQTGNRFKAILSGTLVTSILQSSSLVSLMVLAFVGAGILSMRDAIGVILGANLGTTVTGWLFTFLGFKLKITNIAYLFIGIGALGTIIFSSNKKLNNICSALLGFGLLFNGLFLMKGSISELATRFDVSYFGHWPAHSFILIGLFLTAIIQSSSATMVIILAALHASILPFDSAVAMVIGADLGTTITVFFGAFQGGPDKKRVALSHFLFNFFTAIVASIFMYPLIYLITDIVGIKDQLVGLVFFHSTFNILGITMFTPFIGNFASFLGNRFKHDENIASYFIQNVTPGRDLASHEALLKEADVGVLRVLALNVKGMNLPIEQSFFYTHRRRERDYIESYQEIKELEGEVLEFFIAFQNEEQSVEEVLVLNQVMNAFRSMVNSAKSIKDIHHNINEFESSTNDSKYEYSRQLKEDMIIIYQQLKNLVTKADSESFYTISNEITELNKKFSKNWVDLVYKALRLKSITDNEASTLMNVSTELYLSNKAILESCKILFELNSATISSAYQESPLLTESNS